MVVFALLVTTALALRRNKEVHKRLMLLAYVAILAAAVARFPGVLPLGLLWFFGLTFLPVLALGVTYDLVTRHRVHPAYRACDYNTAGYSLRARALHHRRQRNRRWPYEPER